MAKRHPGLVPLAKEHHEALLLAVRLQQGRRALLRLWSHVPYVQAQLTTAFYRSHLLRHFRAEEEILFPSVDTNVPELRPLVKQLREDHAWIHAAIESIEHGDGDTLTHLLTEFGKRLETHVRAEDRQLFYEFERDASPQVLEEVQRKIEEFYAKPPATQS